MQAKSSGIDKSLLAIVAEGFFSRLGFGLISFALPLYAYHAGLSLAQIGMLISLNSGVAVVLKPLAGSRVDRMGFKAGLTSALGLRSLVALLLIMAAGPWHFWAIRSISGAAKALRDPSVNALIAVHGGKKAIASAYAWYQTAKSVAGSLGKALAGLLLTLSAANFALIFFLAFLLTVLPMLLVVFCVKNTAQPAERRISPVQPSATGLWLRGAKHAPRSKGLRYPSLFPFMGFGFVASAVAQMLHGLFPLLATQYGGLSEAQTGLIFMISTLVILFVGPLCGWVADHVSFRVVLLVRCLANILSSLIYLFWPHFAGVANGKAVDSAGKAAFRPAWGALMADISAYDQQRRGRTMGWMTMGEDAGAMLGPVLAALIWNQWGITLMLITRVVLAAVSGIYGWLLTRSHRKSVVLPPASILLRKKAPSVGRGQPPPKGLAQK